MSRTHSVRRRFPVLGAAICSLMVVALAAPAVRADLNGPEENDKFIGMAVQYLLRGKHMTKHQLDDEISSRWLDKYVETLDPMKMYFNQSDIDQLESKRNQLDNQIGRGDMAFAFQVFQTFLKRVDERLGFVNEAIDGPLDFEVAEEMVIDPDAASYARNDAEARDMWRKRVKYELLVEEADRAEKAEKAAKESEASGDAAAQAEPAGRPAVDPREKIRKRYASRAKRWHQVDHDELIELYLSSLTTSYDPHTTYMSNDTLRNFEIDMKLELDGIGAALSSEDGYTTVSKVVPGGAAAKDGRLKPQDRIVGVGEGVGGALEDVIDMKLSDVVKRIRGKRGTIVRLEVEPAAGGGRSIYDITREQIKLEDSAARGEVIDYTSGANTYKVGVISLPSFYMDMEGARRNLPDYRSTTRDVARLLEDFKAQGVDAVVVDLRNNGGGALTEAVNLTGLFIDHGPIVQVKDSDGTVHQFEDFERGTAWGGPLVVMINKFSASASEIFAGAIQDYGRGLIVGDAATHGKGTVQSLLDISDELFSGPNTNRNFGALKITMQQFYRPNGDSTQNRGVLSDIELPSLTTHLDVGEADLDFALNFDRVKPAEHTPAALVDAPMVQELARMSQDRVARSPEFQRAQRRIDRYKAQKERKTVPLKREDFLAMRSELNAERDVEEELDSAMLEIQPVFDLKNFYNQEAMAIVADYLKLRRVAKAN